MHVVHDNLKPVVFVGTLPRTGLGVLGIEGGTGQLWHRHRTSAAVIVEAGWNRRVLAVDRARFGNACAALAETPRDLKRFDFALRRRERARTGRYRQSCWENTASA